MKLWLVTAPTTELGDAMMKRQCAAVQAQTQFKCSVWKRTP